MDARKYASKNIRPDNVRDGPIQARIVNAFEGERYGRLCLELETGSEFTLNDGNTNILIKAWGHDTDAWIGQEVEFYLATYKDWRSSGDQPEEKETVRVRAISPAKEGANGGVPTGKPALPPSRTAASAAVNRDMDDDIPFAPEWR